MAPQDDLPRPAPLPYTLDGAHAAEEHDDEQAEAKPEETQPPPLRHGPAWRRVLTSAAWVAGCAALLALLVGLASPPPAARKKEAKDNAAPKKAPPKNPAEPPEPPPQPPAKSKAPDPAQEAARAAAEAALAFDRQHPDAHDDALLQLRRGLLAAHATPQAETLSQRLSARRTALTQAAEPALAALRQRIKALREQGRFGEALRACAQAPSALHHTPWQVQVDSLRSELGAEVQRHYLDLMVRAATALRDREFEQARAACEQAATLGIPWMEQIAQRRLTAADAYITTETARWEAHVKERERLARRKAFAALQKPFQQVQEHVAKRHYARAAQLLQELPEDLRTEEAGAAVARVEQRVARLQRVWKAILSGPEAAKGKRLRIHGVLGRIAGVKTDRTGSPVLVIQILTGAARPLEQRLDRLPTQEFLQLAEWALAGQPAADVALDLALLHLAEGNAAEAAKKLAEARAAGADTAALERCLEARQRVASALDAAKANRWDEARPLLEAALDNYADTVPAIVHHDELMQALRRARKAAGESPKARPFQPAEVPLELRVLTLLPETRLGPTAPDDPRDAYFDTPLRRRSPALLGDANWQDYHLALDYTPGAPLIVLTRVSEPQPGQFAAYLLTLDGRHVRLERCTASKRTELKSARVPKLVVPRRHHIVLSVVGDQLALKVDGKEVLRVTDAALKQGRVGLAAPAGEVDVHRFAALLAEHVPND
jgi:hypothetical protein